MLKTAVDTGERLFASRFMLAALVPIILFVLTTLVILVGVEAVEAPLRAVADGGWSKMTLGALTTLAASLLFAQVLYGSLGSIRQLYRGNVPSLPLLSKLMEFPLRRERRGLESRERAVKAAHQQIQAPGWATLLAFGQSQDVRLLSPTEVDVALTLLECEYRNLMNNIRDGKNWTNAQHLRILTRAQELQATQRERPGQFDDQKNARVTSQINRLKQDHANSPKVQEAARQLYAEAARTLRKALNERDLDFPTDQVWFRSTRLGNVASAIETYPLKRYGIDWDALWPRLLFVLPKSARQQIDTAETAVDFALSMSLLSFMTTGTVLIGWMLGTLSPWQAFFFALGAIAGGLLFVQVAIGATRNLGVQAQAAIDLYRLQVIDALQIERPKTPDREYAIWEEVRDLVASEARLRSVRFVPSPQQEATGRKKPRNRRGTGSPTDEENANEEETEGEEQAEDEAEVKDGPRENEVASPVVTDSEDRHGADTDKET